MIREKYKNVLSVWYYEILDDSRVDSVWRRDFHGETACHHQEL